MNSTICTLFENHYHYGVGAFANSLHKNGFQGVIWIGFRGSLPNWARGVKKTSQFYEIELANGCILRFVTVDTLSHLANYKPGFMSLVWEQLSPNSDAIFYFDPDIVIKCRWSFYEEWVSNGIALCADNVYPHLPSDHPIRRRWIDYAEGLGYSCYRELNSYYNSGFIGVHHQHKSALDLWDMLLQKLPTIGIELHEFKKSDRTQPFYSMDQDVLNIMAMITDHPLSTMGLEGMDFAPGGFTMSHASAGAKPWQKRFLLSALQGKPPSLADKEFLANINYPISLYSSWNEAVIKLDARAAAAVGRFIRKGV